MGNESTKAPAAANPTKPQAEATKGAEQAARAAIRVIVADAQTIFRVGVRKIFAVEDDLRVVAQAESLAHVMAAASKTQADVLLLESAIAPNLPDTISELLKRQPALKVVVIAADIAEEDTVECLRRGARGIVNRAITPDLLVKCVRRIALGETWLDNKGVNWLIDAYRAQAGQLLSASGKPRLSDKEKMVIAGVTQGLRNKEIAADVGTTEQVVKNYLRKIYDKLGVNDRLELALYCVHHRLLDGVALKRPASTEGTASAASAGGQRQ